MKFKKIALIILASAAVLFLFYFVFRNSILNYALNKYHVKVKEKYNAELKIGKAYFSSFSTLHLENILIIPEKGAPLLSIKNMMADISFIRLIRRELPYKKLLLDSVYFNLVKNDTANNYGAFLREDKVKSEEIKPDTIVSGYSTLLNNLFNKTFSLLSGEISAHRIFIHYNSDNVYRNFSIPDLFLKGEEFNAIVNDSSFENPVQYIFHGTINKRNRSIHFQTGMKNESQNLLPLISSKSEFKYLFDSVNADINSYKYSDNALTIALSFSFINLKVNHWRISANDVSFNSLKFSGHLFADENKIGFDTSSFLELNNALLNFSTFYDRSNGKTFALKIDMPKISSQNFFESLPEGMFNTLNGIKTSGSLSYHLDFLMNKSNPDSLTFNSELKKYDFKILKYGEEYFSKINSSFSYTAFNDNGPVRTFVVGPENPFFTPLNNISDYLKNSVLTSEDGAFFMHRGFNEDAFRESIAANVKAGRFARGGSTISMQLVKNIFLSRNKTVSRKIEEALIVWLIENNYIVSKERMFEVYLNIIEWGPNVYGISEASHFYFSKNPCDLTLPESIYLASIIPHPKYFKYSFDAYGNLKPFLEGYYRLIANHLIKKEKISQQEFDALQPTVKLSGPALQFIIPTDSIPVDSIQTDELQILD
jgi:hypothetical protein